MNGRGSTSRGPHGGVSAVEDGHVGSKRRRGLDREQCCGRRDRPEVQLCLNGVLDLLFWRHGGLFWRWSSNEDETMDAGVQAHRREWRDGRMDAMAGGRKEGGTWDSNQRTNKENASMADLSLRIKNKKYRIKTSATCHQKRTDTQRVKLSMLHARRLIPPLLTFLPFSLLLPLSPPNLALQPHKDPLVYPLSLSTVSPRSSHPLPVVVCHPHSTLQLLILVFPPLLELCSTRTTPTDAYALDEAYRLIPFL